MEQEEKKDGDYALNTLKDIWKYDPARLLDLGNDLQVLISQNKPEIDEERRASSNFEKLTEDKHRPVSHTLVDATRLLPDIIALAGPALLKAGVKAVGKKAAKETGETVAKKLVGENTTDIAQAFNNSKFLKRDDKDIAAKRWVRNLYENKEAMNRVAGRSLSDDEIKAVRNELPNAITKKINFYNKDVDELKLLVQHAKLVKRIPKELKDAYEPLTEYQWKKLAKNLAELPEYDRRVSFSYINPDRILKGIPKEKHNIVKDVLFEGVKGLKEPLTVADATLKAADAGLNKAAKVNFQTNKELEITPDYFERGSMPTPVSDFIAGMFNVDFNDPARFNKRDIDAFFDFLEDAEYIEPGIKDKWTPRQKVSVMREILSDETINDLVKAGWAESEQKENLNKYYNNKGE